MMNRENSGYGPVHEVANDIADVGRDNAIDIKRIAQEWVNKHLADTKNGLTAEDMTDIFIPRFEKYGIGDNSDGKRGPTAFDQDGTWNDEKYGIFAEAIKTELAERSSEQNILAKDIGMRANNASDKVKQRVQEKFIRVLAEHGDNAEKWLDGLKNEFYHLFMNPSDKNGVGPYGGWTPDEIRELYIVLYGEDLE